MRTLQSPVLIGREEFLALADRRLAAAAEGRGHLLLVAGEAGIGKTRLLAAVAAAARGCRSGWSGRPPSPAKARPRVGCCST